VHPLFSKAFPGNTGPQVELNSLTELEIPETYVLYHGPQAERDLRRLFTAWSWAAGPVGDQYPLLLVGPGSPHLAGLVEEFNLGDSVRSIPAVHLPALAALYRGCRALFHPAPLPAWGDPVRMALACGKPVVALESPRADALVGPAAYLAVAEPGERLLGSALISVIVEESLADRLSQAAQQRQAGWDSLAYSRALGEVYRLLV
jgi:glycosyltransferase involved in cell wall biosynthesis